MLEWTLKTQKEAIVQERKRLETMYKRRVLKIYNGYIPEWIPAWLTKSDEEHLASDVLKQECKNCGELVDRWIETSFSFCDEQVCGISFCEKCAHELVEKFKAF